MDGCRLAEGLSFVWRAASAASENVIFSITNRLYRGGEVKREKTSPLFEIALVLVHFNHVASAIVNANDRIV